MKKIMKSILMFMVFWIILTEKINIEIGIVGIILCCFVYVFNRQDMFSDNNFCFNKILYTLLYSGILLKEIILANWDVAKIVLSKHMDISPETIRIDTKLKSPFYRMILANSITLTPGTLTVDLNGAHMIVHCLKKEYAEQVSCSKFEKILLKIEAIEHDQ